MKYISWGKVDKKLLIPVIGGIVTLLLTTLISKNVKYNVIRKNPLILSIYVSIGMTLSFNHTLLLNIEQKKDL